MRQAAAIIPFPVQTSRKEKALRLRQLSGRDSVRFEDLERELRQRIPDFDIAELRTAIEFVHQYPSKGPKPGGFPYIADPITSVRTLVKYSKADRETILSAALLHSSGELKDVESFFGPKVRGLIERTLFFMTHKLPRSASDETVMKFRLLALWAMEGLKSSKKIDANPIVLQTGNLIDNLQYEVEKPGYFSVSLRERLITYADKVFSDLTYISGHGDLRKKIMNLSLQIQHRAAYKEICTIIEDSEKRNEIDAIPNSIAALIKQKLGWSNEDKDPSKNHFRIEYRKKSAASAFAKALKKKEEAIKGLTFAEAWPILREEIANAMGDLRAVRVILNRRAIEDWIAANVVDEKSKRSQDAISKEYARQCQRVYGIWSKEFGRGNKKMTHTRERDDGTFEEFSPIQACFAELAITDPRAEDLFRKKNPAWFEREKKIYPNILDARFADYLKLPKDNGYQALHDLGYYIDPVTGKPVKYEFHVVDIDRHRNNTEGPMAGHDVYKAIGNLGWDAEDDEGGSVQSWRRMCKEGPDYRGVKGVFVFQPISATESIIHNISYRPDVAGFKKAAKSTEWEFSIHDPFGRFNDEHTYGPGTPLPNGVTVTPVRNYAKLEPA